MNVEDLSGLDLARAVAKANEWTRHFDTLSMLERYYYIDQDGDFLDEEMYKPSTDWYQGGEFIEDLNISILYYPTHWLAQSVRGVWCCKGSTPLEAAMRCYVASVLGEEVEC